MSEENNVTDCQQCGNPTQPGDTFCGVCGASVASVTPEDTQVIPRPAAAQATQAPATRNNRSFLIAGAVGVILLLLVGGGAIALVGSGSTLFGGSDPEPVPPADTQEPTPMPKTTEESTEVSETTSSSSLSERDQYEEFARDYYAAFSDGDWEETYSMLYETSISGATDSQDEFTEEEWIEIHQTLTDEDGSPPPLDGVTVDQNEEATDSPARVTLRYEDGTQETITVIIPLAVNSGDEDGPQRYLTEEEIEGLNRVLVSGGTTEDFGSTSPSDLEADAEEAATDYYQAAGIEDWEYTYDHLDSETQSLFTLEEWTQKNQYYWDQNQTIYDILSVDLISDSGEPITEVTVRITGEDGSSFTRKTYWVLEDGEWLHRFSEEEEDVFMPELSFEEFVEAQEGNVGEQTAPNSNESFPEDTNGDAGEEI